MTKFLALSLTGSRLLLFRGCVSPCLSLIGALHASFLDLQCGSGGKERLFSITRTYSSAGGNYSPSPRALSRLKRILYSSRAGSKPDDPKLDALVKITIKDVHLYTVPQLVSLLKCLQKVRFHSHELFKSIVFSLIDRWSELSLEAASGVVRMYREQGMLAWADNLSHFYTDRLFNALTAGEYIHPRTVSNLSDTDQWPAGFREALQNYVLSQSEQFDFQSLTEILTFMLRKNSINFPMLHKCADMAHNLLQTSLPDTMFSDVGRLYWVYGKCSHYHPDLFASLRQLLQVEDRFLSSWFVTTVAWSCAKVRYYDPLVMDLIAQYSLRYLPKFSHHDLSSLVYACGSLNHPHQQLFTAVADRLLETGDTGGVEQAHWVLVWASMVLHTYDSRILSRVLSSQFMEASTRISGYKVTQPLQMSVALNNERPDLGFGVSQRPPGHKWGECFPSLQGMDMKYMQLATALKVEDYRSRDRTRTFAENVHRALTLIVGGGQYLNDEVMSLSGYVIDFEIVLSERNEPVPIPNEWRSRAKEVVLRSIGIGGLGSRQSTRLDADTLIEIARHSENCTLDTMSGEELVESSKSVITGRETGLDHTASGPVKLVNLASDWGLKFGKPQETIARRIAIEADGPPHFARNCDHMMGPTVLKHRQLQALGWEVVQIPFTEWSSLKTGDDHVHYLSEKIFGQK